jgi:hypothetical protein
MSFSKSLLEFCGDLLLTFPELKPTILRASTTTPALFWDNWVGTLDILIAMDETKLFTERKGFIVAAVRLVPVVWNELSDSSKQKIWKYLRKLIIESALENDVKKLEFDVIQKLMEICLLESPAPDSVPTATAAGAAGAGSADSASSASSTIFTVMMNQLKPMIDDFKNFFNEFDFKDISGMAASLPDIPEHLRKGHIASLVTFMMKQISPEEFGIPPELMKSDNIEEIMKTMTEVVKTNPKAMLTAGKKLAEKIKTQLLGGSLSRKDLLVEAKEYIELFKEHPLYKKLMVKFTEYTGTDDLYEWLEETMEANGGGGSGGSGDDANAERRRIVKERLRAKLAASKKK